ncbi:hypothetical protein [Saccharomonospora iraqiensis]|uniref:hypothetical protein n=1 Tax=Saccharomonospora iraqiensis TaxID=52698 RepID=UPI00022E03E2|nr:hypothetical protein [Saccharomonospora iraqiensis]
MLRAWFRRLWAGQGEGHRAQEHVVTAYEPLPQAVRAELTLPSADDYLRFTVTVRAEARWRGAGQAPPALTDVAAAGLSRRGEVVSREYTLTEARRVRGELNRVLLNWEDVPATGGVQARAVCEEVVADPDLVAAVAERERIAGKATVRSWQREQPGYHFEQECALIRDPLRGTARWMLDNPGRPADAVQVAQQLTALRDLLAPVPEQRPESAGRLVDELLDDSDEACRDRLLRTLEKIFAEYGRPELADRLPSVADGGDGTDGAA